MTPTNTPINADKCALILHRIVSEIRTLSEVPGNEESINALAELCHNFPMYLVGKDDFAGQDIRGQLVWYQTRYNLDLAGYIAIMDMSDDDFRAMFRPPSYDWAADIPASAMS